VRAILRIEALAVLLWGLGCLGIAWRTPVLDAIATAALLAYLAASLGRMRRPSLVLAALLLVAAVPLALATGRPSVLLEALAAAAIFGGFFVAVAFLRGTANERPEVAAARRAFAAFGPAQRSGGFLVGSHFLGVVINIGSMAIAAPILGPGADAAARRAGAEVCLRGMCLACLWSPFWVAMGIATQHLPGVALWQIMALGLATALVGLVFAHVLYARAAGPRLLAEAAIGLSPLMPPVLVAALVVVATTSLLPVTTLQALVAAMPLVCVAGLVPLGRKALTRALATTWKGAGTLGDEIMLLTAALVLGRALEAAVDQGGIAAALAGFALPPIALIALMIFGMTAAALVGVHQIVTATVSLVVVGGAGLSDLVLMQAVLIGWCFASMVGISAISVATAAAMFAVPRERLAYGPNIRFAVLWGAAATLLLAAVDAAIG